MCRVQGGVLAFLLFLAIAPGASAELEYTVGLHAATYAETSTEAAVSFTLSRDDTPFYIAGTLEQPKIRMVGQPLGDADLFSIGIGMRHQLAPGLYAFAEGGYSMVDVQTNDLIEHEAVWTKLTGDHLTTGLDWQQIPESILPRGETVPRYDTSYDLEGGYYGRIGFMFMWRDTIGITAAYRALKLDQEYAIYNPALPKTPEVGYWRNDDQLDVSAFEIGAVFRF